MDHKIFATILFRVLGVSYFLYGVFYAPYFLVTATFSDTFIISSFAILSYFAAGLCLFFLSRPLAVLVVKGFDRNSVPPPPPRFESS
jgi:hypothetical protein